MISEKSICSPEKKDIKQQSTQTNLEVPPAHKIAIFRYLWDARKGQLIKR